MITIFPDLEQLSLAAARLITERALAAASEHGRFTIALSGGNTPRRTYELLAMEPLRDQMPWTQVHVFWGDERYVLPDDPRSNQCMARQTLLDHVPVPPEQVHPIDCEGSPNDSAARYEQCLRQFFGPTPRFDLILLGLGENGHTASLLPGSPVLAERVRWVADVQPGSQPLQRITLTAPVINHARTVLFLVSGADKASTLRAVHEGARDPDRLPAQLVQPLDGELLWFVDEPAAAQVAVRQDR